MAKKTTAKQSTSSALNEDQIFFFNLQQKLSIDDALDAQEAKDMLARIGFTYALSEQSWPHEIELLFMLWMLMDDLEKHS